ncbi:hypothetical protein BD769DRAFT_1784146 [Suillus cothurnatus]|nr:hypothetical protein BD769DRAFT_1784146 [Suillus cothurnatus]
MKKIFGLEKARHQRVISNRDIDFVIDSETEQENEGRERLSREEDDPSELARLIEYLTAISSEDWTLVLEVCERASATEANAKEAMKSLRREFQYGEPKAQLSAARLWAIMLRDASDIFLTQISSRKFIDTLDDVLTSSRTSPVVRSRLMDVLAAAAFITNSRPNPLPKPEPSPFSLKDRDRDRDSFRALWTRLKPVDKPDVGIPFDVDDAMFSPPIVLMRPPIEKERPSRKSLRQCGVIPPEEDMKRLFQECKIAKGYATVLSEMLAYAKPEQIEGSLIPEFLAKCRGSQELIYTQIPWASAGAERSRNDRERNAEGNGRAKSQPDVQFSSPPSRDYHGMDAKIYVNAEGEEQTLEEELLVALLDANEVLFGVLRMYDDVMRLAEEQEAVEIGNRDVKIDPRHIEKEYLGQSHPYYGEGSSRTPSPISPTTSLSQLDLPPVIPSQTYFLPRLSFTHPDYGSPPPYVSTTLPAPPPPPLGPRSHTCLPHPLLPTPSSSSYHTSLVRPSAKVVEEVDDKQRDSGNLRFVLGTAGATSSLTVVPTHPLVEEEASIPMPASKSDTTIAASNHDKAIDGASDTYWSRIDLDFSTDTIFAYSSKANLEKMLWEDALLDAQKVMILNPSSYLGYQLKHEALHGAHRYDEAIETFGIMLSKLDNAPEIQLQELRQQYLSVSEADDAIRRVIYAQLDDAPLRLLDTTSGLLCDREAQICAFKLSTEYKGLLSLIVKHADIRTERIKEVVTLYFRCVMLSHMWQGKEPLLHDIKDKVVYELNPVDGIVKLQSFCKTARDTGYRWAWIDTCCIDQSNNAELQKSLNSMFIWYRHSALTIVYLVDVPALSKPGALARSAWNTRGWTLPEFLAPKVILFYQRDWTLYLNDHSCNHKESFTIMRELENTTGVDAHFLVTFRPGMAGAREKLRWASTRVTTVQEDVAYSLFGIFGIHLPVIYGEKKQNALGRLLQEVVAQSGDITALDWVGKSSEFNSCLPADITSYRALPCVLPSLSEDDIQTSVSRLQNAVDIDVALKLHRLLDDLGAPRFANRRLRLPCIAFLVTEVRRSHAQDEETCFAYEVKANGLRDLLITTEDKLIQFSRAKPILQTFLLVRPWDPYLLELPDFADNAQGMDNWSVRGSMFRDNLSVFSGETGPVDSQSYPRALRLIVRLGQPFGAFLLARQRGGEYKRIASDRNIIAQVKEVANSVHRMHVRTLEVS